MSTRDAEDVVEAILAVEAWGRERSWEGTDPYDGLNARRFTSQFTRTASSRRVLTQLVKRCPVNLRPLLAIPGGQSAAALASVASAYARRGPWLDPDRRVRLGETVAALWSARASAFDLPCWGYHFPVQTRVFYYPRGAPNTIATAFAGHAFLDAYELEGEDQWLAIAAGTAEFFLKHVRATEAPDGLFFGYLVGDATPIHNANMLVCCLLARLGRQLGRPDLREVAAGGVAYLLAHQRPDGSWPYGEEPHLAWVDNFHSGYVLEALMRCRDAGIDGTDGAVERGLRFYARALFRPDGAPLYQPTSLYPIDIQCVAQGIQTFAYASRLDSIYAGNAWRVARYALRDMRRTAGEFMFQRRRFWANRIPHVRWCQAPMLLALTHLMEVSDEGLD